MIRRESVSGSFAYLWLKNRRHYAKSGKQENNMFSCLPIFCLSLCMPLLLPIIVLVMSLSPALAAAKDFLLLVVDMILMAISYIPRASVCPGHTMRSHSRGKMLGCVMLLLGSRLLSQATGPVSRTGLPR